MLPDWLDADRLAAVSMVVIVVLIVAAFVAWRVVTKLVTRLVVLVVVAAAVFGLWVKRDDFRQCDDTGRNCSIFGYEIPTEFEGDLNPFTED